jgi:hypothetical protein
VVPIVTRTDRLQVDRASLGRQLDGRVEDGSDRFVDLAHYVGSLINIRNLRKKNLTTTKLFFVVHIRKGVHPQMQPFNLSCWPLCLRKEKPAHKSSRLVVATEMPRTSAASSYFRPIE